jgi:hypothetical protein
VRRPDGGYDRSADDLPPATRATMPADWSETVGRDFLGVVRCRRTFQQPTNLEAHQRVWLVVEPPRSCGMVRLNGELLGCVRFSAPAGRFDATRLLDLKNTLEIDVEHPELDDNGMPLDDGCINVPGGLVGEARLEIEEGARISGQGSGN